MEDFSELQKQIRLREDGKREALRCYLEALESYANTEERTEIFDAVFFGRILEMLWGEPEDEVEGWPV